MGWAPGLWRAGGCEVICMCICIYMIGFDWSIMSFLRVDLLEYQVVVSAGVTLTLLSFLLENCQQDCLRRQYQYVSNDEPDTRGLRVRRKT